MGTTRYAGRLTVKEVVDQEFAGKDRQRVVKYASVKGRLSDWSTEIYVAWRCQDASVFCIVMLVKYSQDGTYVKVIDEDMGPTVTQCPKSVLRCLTPTESRTAAEWRKACEDYAAWRKSVESGLSCLVPGDVVLVDGSYANNCAAVYVGENGGPVFTALDSAFVNMPMRGVKQHTVAVLSAAEARDVGPGAPTIGQRVRLTEPYAGRRAGLLEGRVIAVASERVSVPFAKVCTDDEERTYRCVPLCVLEVVHG